jgi:hypothetical protein
MIGLSKAICCCIVSPVQKFGIVGAIALVLRVGALYYFEEPKPGRLKPWV